MGGLFTCVVEQVGDLGGERRQDVGVEQSIQTSEQERANDNGNENLQLGWLPPPFHLSMIGLQQPPTEPYVQLSLYTALHLFISLIFQRVNCRDTPCTKQVSYVFGLSSIFPILLFPLDFSAF